MIASGVGRNVMYVAGARQHEFSNRFTVTSDRRQDVGRDECLQKYEAWLIEILQSPDTRMRFESLRKKTLGCWCKADDECHADVIIRLLDKLMVQKTDINVKILPICFNLSNSSS